MKEAHIHYIEDMIKILISYSFAGEYECLSNLTDSDVYLWMDKMFDELALFYSKWANLIFIMGEIRQEEVYDIAYENNLY